MNVPKRLTACLLVLAVLLLSGCPGSMPPSIKPTPPLVTDCLAVPDGLYTEPPKPEGPLTAEWAKRMWAWANETLGIATEDRIEWQGERDCVRAKADTGAIR